VEQHVVEGIAARPGGGHEHLQVFQSLLLARKIVEDNGHQRLSMSYRWHQSARCREKLT
jgi:hypothetical protein